MSKMSDKDLEFKEFLKDFGKLKNLFYHDQDFVISEVKELDRESLVNLLDCTVVALCYENVSFSSIKKRVEIITEKVKNERHKKGKN